MQTFRFLMAFRALRWGMLLVLSLAWSQAALAAGACSAYKGQVLLNELRIGSTSSLNKLNQIELYNRSNVAQSVWQNWKLVMNYGRSGSSPTAYGPYLLSTGFSAQGQFIYNSDKVLYLRNRNGRMVDVALLDQNDDFVDYVAINGKMQTVPGCFGSTTQINTNTSSSRVGDAMRLPDGGTWPSTISNTSVNTIGITNVCSSGVSDLVVSNGVDIASPTALVTPVTYTVSAFNKSCTNILANVQVTVTNISATNFDGLTYTPSGSTTTSPSGSNRTWTIGTLAPGAVATLTITGTPINIGTLSTVATGTSTSSLVNTADDSATATIAVKDANYVGFDVLTDSITEGSTTTYSASISSDLEAGANITVNYTISGTAGSGDTNLPASGSVTITPSNADNPQSTSIDFTVKNDYVYEPTKSIVLTITSISSTDRTVKLATADNVMTISLLDDEPLPTDTVVVRGYGTQAGGVGPFMELWLNGTKVGEANVSATTVTEYAFPVALPDTGTAAIDVVFNNDANIGGADRNLLVNSVRVRGQVLLPTDAGVTYDKGLGALATDGVDVIAGQVSMSWNGALRFGVNLTRPAIAEYHLEEGALTGTAGEVKDTAGYTGGPFNGKAVGSPLPVPTRSSPALSDTAGTSGTCGYASLAGPAAGGGAIDITGLPVSTTSNAQTTVAFWLYWNGTSTGRPIGWQNYDLYLAPYVFGFNTSNSDVYGFDPTSLANGWHHIVATFTNGDVTQNVMYVDGVKKTLTAMQSAFSSTNAVVQSALRLGGWVASTDYRFTGRLDEVKVFTGGLSQTQVTALFTETHACNAALISQYHMDENAWTGTAGEVLDSSGRGVNGTATGTTGRPKPLHDSPALSGTQLGTCGYGNFGGAATKQVVSLGAPDLGIGGNPAFSVSAWVRWGVTPSTGNQWANIVANGDSGAGQFWLQHAQLNNKFEFAVKTSVTRKYVWSKTAPVAGQWYHLAGVYDGTALHIYVNGVLDDFLATPLTGTVAPYLASYNLNIGADSTQVRAFQGDIDEVQFFGGALTASQVSALVAERHACPVYPPSTPLATNFNCVEPRAAADTGRIYTKLAGTPFNLEVAALLANGSVDTTYASSANRNVTVELVDGSSTTACSSRAAISPAVSQTLSFAASDAGRKASAAFTVATAYPNLRCRVTDAGDSPSIVGCSSDSFAVRPTSLSVTSTATADSSGTSTTATPALKTGSSFTLTATSNVTGTTTAPRIDSAKLSAHTGAAQVGSLSGSFGNAIPGTGVATGSSFSYSEVGYFRLAANGVWDDTFTAVDSAAGDCTADFSNTAVGGKYGCYFGNTAASSYFGRFIPDHFNVSANSNGSMAPACLTGSFTYAGQGMGYATPPSITISPINSAAGTTVTQNYTGAFQKLTAANVAITVPTADGAQFGSDGLTKTALSASMSAGTLSNSAGVMTYTLKSSDLFTYTRNANAMVPPYTSAITLPVAAVTDGEVTAASLPTLLPSGAALRYGRIKLQNVFGSEKLPLTIPIQAQHYVTNASGTGFFTNNTLDHCTPLSVPAARTLTASASPDGLANLYFYPVAAGRNQLLSTDVTASAPVKLLAGQANLQFTAPAKRGWLDMILSVPSYLTSNWGNCNGQGSDALQNDLPCARATFGVYGSKAPLVYMRENY